MIINEESPLNLDFESIPYIDYDRICIRFELTKPYVFSDLYYSSSGFELAEEILYTNDDENNSSCFECVLKYDVNVEQAYFLLTVETECGNVFSTSVYGISTEHGVFLSNSSYDAAFDNYCFYQVRSDMITEAEYNAALQKRYKQLGTESVTIISPSLNEINNVNQGLENIQLSTVTFPTITTTTVTGTLGWIDDSYVWHPMQYNRVDICNASTGITLGTVFTDINGVYTYLYSDTEATLDIFIKIYASGENSYIKTGYGGEYIYTSSTQSNVSQGSTVNISWDVDMTSDIGKAIQISQAINVATKYVYAMNGQYLPIITVKYPHVESNDSCFYRSSEDTIYIKSNGTSYPRYPNSYASWDVVMHEYGHHVQAELGITNSPGGSHSFSYNLADTTASKDKGIKLAWGEAYASVFGGMAQNYFLASLQNIATVGDIEYRSYNTARLNYETPVFLLGEACEASVIGVLWDLFDTNIELHDDISLSHQEYWHMMKNSSATTLSEFCEYFSTVYTFSRNESLGELLSYHKMSVSDITFSMVEGLPSFSWTANGTSSTLQNDRFDLLIYNYPNSNILKIENITATSYTLTENEWEQVLNSYGNTYNVMVIAHQVSIPSTGGYYSENISVTKPSYNQSSSLVQNTYSSIKYSEQIITLTPNSYYDFYVTFGVTGQKLVQTFGTKDTVIELYSSSGELLVSASQTDDAGYSFNSFFSYYTYAETQYIIRVRFSNVSDCGTTKLVLLPATGSRGAGVSTISSYDDILSITGTTSFVWNSYSQLNLTRVITFTAPESGEYTFEIDSDFDTQVYVIDPRSSDVLVDSVDYDNDSGDDFNAKLTKTLTPDIPYLIIFSGYNICSEDNTGYLTLNIYKS